MNVGDGPRITAQLIFTIVVLLLASEAFLRSPLARSRLLLPTHYYQEGVPLRELALQDVQRAEGRVDVLFVGSSIVRTNIRPLLFDELVAAGGALADEPGIEIVSFNAGLSGLMPDAARFYADHFWLDRAQPRLVVQGIRYNELASPLTAADHERLINGRIEHLWMSDRPADRFQALAIENVRLLQYQGWLTAALDRRRGGRVIDARGYTPTGLTLEEALADDLIGPAEAYTGRESLDVGLAAIRGLRALCEARGIGFALLNIPEHPDRYQEPSSDALYDDYLETLYALARAEDFTVIDPTEGDPRAFSAQGTFSDYHHMTPDGAAALTRAIVSPIRPVIARALEIR